MENTQQDDEGMPTLNAQLIRARLVSACPIGEHFQNPKFIESVANLLGREKCKVSLERLVAYSYIDKRWGHPPIPSNMPAFKYVCVHDGKLSHIMGFAVSCAPYERWVDVINFFDAKKFDLENGQMRAADIYKHGLRRLLKKVSPVHAVPKREIDPERLLDATWFTNCVEVALDGLSPGTYPSEKDAGKHFNFDLYAETVTQANYGEFSKIDPEGKLLMGQSLAPYERLKQLLTRKYENFQSLTDLMVESVTKYYPEIEAGLYANPNVLQKECVMYGRRGGSDIARLPMVLYDNPVSAWLMDGDRMSVSVIILPKGMTVWSVIDMVEDVSDAIKICKEHYFDPNKPFVDTWKDDIRYAGCGTWGDGAVFIPPYAIGKTIKTVKLGGLEVSIVKCVGFGFSTPPLEPTAHDTIKLLELFEPFLNDPTVLHGCGFQAMRMPTGKYVAPRKTMDSKEEPVVYELNFRGKPLPPEIDKRIRCVDATMLILKSFFNHDENTLSQCVEDVRAILNQHDFAVARVHDLEDACRDILRAVHTGNVYDKINTFINTFVSPLPEMHFLCPYLTYADLALETAGYVASLQRIAQAALPDVNIHWDEMANADYTDMDTCRSTLYELPWFKDLPMSEASFYSFMFCTWWIARRNMQNAARAIPIPEVHREMQTIVTAVANGEIAEREAAREIHNSIPPQDVVDIVNSLVDAAEHVHNSEVMEMSNTLSNVISQLPVDPIPVPHEPVAMVEAIEHVADQLAEAYSPAPPAGSMEEVAQDIERVAAHVESAPPEEQRAAVVVIPPLVEAAVHPARRVRVIGPVSDWDTRQGWGDYHKSWPQWRRLKQMAATYGKAPTECRTKLNVKSTRCAGGTRKTDFCKDSHGALRRRGYRERCKADEEKTTRCALPEAFKARHIYDPDTEFPTHIPDSYERCKVGRRMRWCQNARGRLVNPEKGKSCAKKGAMTVQVCKPSDPRIRPTLATPRESARSASSRSASSRSASSRRRRGGASHS